MAENKNNGNMFYAGDFEKFENVCLYYVHKFTREMYTQRVNSKINLCESHIEKVFLLAIEAFLICFDSIEVYPQYKIGKYRVDFFICYNKGDIEKYLIVELDGHQFHETNEQQRRYEKNRDRYFQTQGFPVFHYTGSQVIGNPFKIVTDCMNYLILK